jgi:manganese/zinc/iron transport system ATP- binding protein
MAARQISQLSGGQQQRALLARALAQEAEVLLLDEPLVAVDAETRTVLATLMDELRGHGRTLLVATHDVSGLAAEFDSAVFLSEGRVLPAAGGEPIQRLRTAGGAAV